MDGKLQDLTEFLQLLSVSSIYRWRFESTRKKYLHKYSTEMSKNYTFPTTIRSLVCFLLNFFCCIFLWSFFFGTLKSAATYRSLHLIRLARKNFKKTSLATSVEHSWRRTHFLFLPDSPVYHLFPSRWDSPQNMS